MQSRSFSSISKGASSLLSHSRPNPGAREPSSCVIRMGISCSSPGAVNSALSQPVVATLPPNVRTLVDALATLPGAVAVALGGSRAAGGADPGSDWDLAVYYRGGIELSALAAYGE